MRMRNLIRAPRLLIWLGLMGLAAARAGADEDVLLTIRITTGETGRTEVVEMGYDALAALPQRQFSTSTNWTDGVQRFTGVPLTDLLDAVGVRQGRLELVALNDYSTVFEADNPTNAGALLAYLRDGARMTPREKGPLWLVYDYDSSVTYRTETIYARSIWQLDRINISH